MGRNQVAVNGSPDLRSDFMDKPNINLLEAVFDPVEFQAAGDAVSSDNTVRIDAAPERNNPLPAGDEVVLWPLVNGGFTRISRSDVDVVARHKWRALRIYGHIYACTTIAGVRVYLHRLLCGEYRAMKREEQAAVANHVTPVDHADRDGLNNTRANLRRCDNRQNQQNGIGRPFARTSRFKGVAFCQDRKTCPWRATITLNGKQVHGGYFSREEEAARRYDSMAREYFGEFARVNNV